MILKCECFTHFGSCLLKLHDISTSQLDASVTRCFPFAGTAQEEGAGGRSGAAGIPVHVSLMWRFPRTKTSRDQ